MAKNEVMCLPHQITSKEIFYNWSKLTMIHFLRLVEAPVQRRASQSFNKINVLLAGGGGERLLERLFKGLNTPALLHVSQEVTETSLGA